MKKKEGQLALRLGHGGVREGAGRKKTDLETRKVSLSLEPELWIVLESIKEIEERTMAAVIKDLIERGLDREN